jgi:hypothetical protein
LQLARSYFAKAAGNRCYRGRAVLFSGLAKGERLGRSASNRMCHHAAASPSPNDRISMAPILVGNFLSGKKQVFSTV